MEQKAYLVLENGTVFEGKRFGAVGETIGEVVFTTAMTGYLETLTDPSCYGQIVVQTFPQIGNYGVIPSDFEGKRPYLKAYVVRDWCDFPSNFRSEGRLDAYLAKNGVIGLYDIDTRELTRIVREHGVMNAKIMSELKTDDALMTELKQYTIRNAIAAVTTPKIEVYTPAEKKYKVVLWDFGAKENVCRELLNRGCEVIKVPATTTAQTVIDLCPDGIMLSNGPGDPTENEAIIEQLKEVSKAKIPTFAICLGHQLFALSQGAQTRKLKYGHRGENQPVKNLKEDKIFVTSQNHGYTVLPESLPKNAEISYVNANDGTCEGITYTDMPAFTVQFHPQAAGGPLDTLFLFDDFVRLMEQNR